MNTDFSAEDIRSLNITGKTKPRFQELYQELKQKILDGELAPSLRLPPTRTLAAQLSIARNTVTAAYNQLMAEGYLQAKTGSGTYVADTLPEQWFHSHIPKKQSSSEQFQGSLSQYGKLYANQTVTADHNPSSTFAVGVPDLSAFPWPLWKKAQNHHSEITARGCMGFGSPAGLPELRESIASYLRSSRSVKCTPNNIVITNGAQQALALCAHLLINKGDYAAIEEPGYRGAHRAFLAAGAKLLPCPTDKEGLVTNNLNNLAAKPKLLYTSPAHQYPTGAILPLQRRMELLEWSAHTSCWLIEDDYDSEYHYRNRPLASLQGLSSQQQVIYIGSFSKVLFPSLRLGYVVLPDALLPGFIAAHQAISGEIPLHTQATVNTFIREGHFHRHIRRMRLLYEKKQQILQNACRTLSPWCTAPCSGSGMHQVLYLHDKYQQLEQSLHKALTEEGIYSSRLSTYYASNQPKSGLVLGFANSSETDIINGIAAIRKQLTTLSTPQQAPP